MVIFYMVSGHRDRPQYEVNFGISVNSKHLTENSKMDSNIELDFSVMIDSIFEFPVGVL